MGNWSRAKTWGRQLGAGRWLYRHVYRPLEPARWILGFGARGAIRHILGERQMRAAARRLPPWNAPVSDDALRVTYLTGQRHWHQTIVAAHSLARQIAGNLRPTFVDDGTLTSTQAAALLRVFPHAILIRADAAEDQLEKVLPPASFPCLRMARASHPFMRKLLDVRAGSSDWQLYLDSDMLFFRRPDFLLDCATAETSCYMQDRVHGYIASRERISAVAGTAVPAMANAGIVALHDAHIDWHAVERWCRLLGPAHPMLEQTLSAMLQGVQRGIVAPPQDYHILYENNEDAPKRPVLLHYIFRAKLRFFAEDWRRIVRPIEAPETVPTT